MKTPPVQSWKLLRRGSLTVEAALLLPLVLMITFAIIEYGWMFLKHEQVTNAARQAARLAATVDATNGQVNTRITSLMTDYGMAGSGYTPQLTPGNIATVARGNLVTVQISVPYANVSITGITMLFPVPTTLTARVSMAKEGP